jgi:tetratricopeptide (TPR) repeat protein
VTNYGALLEQLERYDEAEVYYREALDMSRKLGGAEHPSTGIIINNLAALYSRLSRLTEAETLYREALSGMRSALGETHPRTLNTIRSLYRVLFRLGRTEEAESLVRDVLEQYRKDPGPEAPPTLEVLSDLGSALRGVGKFRDAEKAYREAFEIRRKVLGPEEVDTLEVGARLGELLGLMERNAEAVEILTSIETPVRRTLAMENPSGCASFLSALGRARVALGYEPSRFPLAEANLLEAQALLDQLTERRSADWRACTQGLIDLYSTWSKQEGGKAYSAKAAEWQAKLDAVADPDGEK